MYNFWSFIFVLFYFLFSMVYLKTPFSEGYKIYLKSLKNERILFMKQKIVSIKPIYWTVHIMLSIRISKSKILFAQRKLL